jgi:IS30 family transposase
MKHMSLSARVYIENGLNNNSSIREIARGIDKAHNTVIKEIGLRKQYVKGYALNLNGLLCPKLRKSPYVCNGCESKNKCRQTKYFYYAEDAHANYKTSLSESRQGIDLTAPEFHTLKNIICEDISKKHSFAMIIMNHPEIEVCERTLYEYQNKGYLDIANIDLPRKVRYKKRKKKKTGPKRFKRDPQILDGRRYTDFKKYIVNNNITYYAQMDTLEGGKGESCLLTFAFISLGTLLAFKLENRDSACVSSKILELKEILGYEMFRKVFPVILTDNGSEFFNVEAIEDNGPDIKDTRLFFCDPGRSDQKGCLENSHEYIRRYIEKGEDISLVSDNDIRRMINHINSAARKKYNPDTAYKLFVKKFGRRAAENLGLYPVLKTEVILSPDLFKNPLTEKEIKSIISFRNAIRNAGKGRHKKYIK